MFQLLNKLQLPQPSPAAPLRPGVENPTPMPGGMPAMPMQDMGGMNYFGNPQKKPMSGILESLRMV
jgi:hypothetical protein